MNAGSDIQAQGLTRTLAAQAHALRFADIPDDVRAWARQCVLDYLACAAAGAQEDLTRILLDELSEMGGAPDATVIARGVRLPALSAAIVNGGASHALDFDDVNMAMPGHPSVAILPGLLALAEQRGSGGADLLTAFVAGYELQCRIGRSISPGHYDVLGFHATATVGSFGAAASCAHLLGLDAEQTALALGIAATQAAGLKSMFGTMCKPLHAGKASHHGLLAAKLAARGFTSRPDAVECPQGFARTHSQDFHPERALEAPAAGWHIRNNLFKYHAACYLTHAPIEAARKLREQHRLTPDRIERITLEVDEACDRVCNIPAPRTGLEAKFSLRLTTAMGLAGVDTGRLSTYAAATTADPTLVALRDKLDFRFRQGTPHTQARLELLLTDGQRVEAGHDSGVPAADVSEQGRRLEQKFTALVGPVLGAGRGGDILERVRGLESLPNVGDLMRLCAAP